MVAVVEASRSRRSVEVADATRVVRLHIVERVTYAQLIGPAELMVDLAKRVGAVHWVGVDTSGHWQPLVRYLRESCIDGANAFGRDAHDASLIEHLAFDIGEIERAIAPDRAAETRPELLLVHWQPGSGQRISPIERIVAKESVDRTVQCVRAT